MEPGSRVPACGLGPRMAATLARGLALALTLLALVLAPSTAVAQWTDDGSAPTDHMAGGDPGAAGESSGPGSGAGGAGNSRSPVDPALTQVLHFAHLPGFTRSVYGRGYALIAPESRVMAGLTGWRNANGAVLVSPAMGAHFTMTLIEMAANSTSGRPLPGVERLVYVLDGHVDLTEGAGADEDDDSSPSDGGRARSGSGGGGASGGHWRSLNAGGFAYFPPGHAHSLESMVGASVLMYERRYAPSPAHAGSKPPRRPQFVSGSTDAQPTLPTGEMFVLRKLLPVTAEYDFNIHVMDFMPGEHLAVKELHFNQHGLLMVEGQGIYRLADTWHAVQSGDAIYMGPFVTQWFAALAPGRSRYVLYKDVNRDPLAHSGGAAGEA